MKFQFVAPSLTSPTVESLKEDVVRAFKKLSRLVHEDVVIRISVNKDGDYFKILCEMRSGFQFVARSHDRDLRKAINDVARDFKTLVLKHKEKALIA